MIIATMLALAGPVWVPGGVGPGGAPVTIDRSSLTWRNLQRVRWRLVLPDPRRDGTAEERHLDLVDCAQGLNAVIETVSLDASGRVIGTERDSEDLALQRLSPPTPDTVGESVAERACRLRPPPPRRKR